MKTLTTLAFITLQLLALLGFGFFSIIIIPAVMFICGSENAIGYSKEDPTEFRTAMVTTVMWTAYLIFNLILPSVKKHIVRESKEIKPGTWYT